jgi:hypothetical protein
MILPLEITEVLANILDVTAKALDKKLQELAIAQTSLSLNQEISLLPQEIVAEPLYLKLEPNRENSNYSKAILEMLGECKAKYINKQLDRAELKLSNISSNFNRKINNRILTNNPYKHRLLVLAAPYKISLNCIASLRENLDIELNEDLKSFFDYNYPFDSQACPVEFYSDYFYKAINDDDVDRLHEILAYIPTLILHGSISDYKAYFHLKFWLPYSDHILAYTLPVWYWEESFEVLDNSSIHKQKALRIIRQIIISGSSGFEGINV